LIPIHAHDKKDPDSLFTRIFSLIVTTERIEKSCSLPLAWKSNFWNANVTFAEAVCKSIQRGIVQKFKKGESKQTTRLGKKKNDKIIISNRLHAL
jgi:hypothetical protein